MAKEVINIRIEVDEESKELDVTFDTDLNDSMAWDSMSFAQKVAAVLTEASYGALKSVIEHEGSNVVDKSIERGNRPKYPCRCRIVENDGAVLHEGQEGVLVSKTPEDSVPKLGRTGTAHLCEDGRNVRIDLDDGSTLMGYECWWEPIADCN